MIVNILRWIAVLALAFAAGKLMTNIKMPSILGWLIVGMLLGPHAVNLMPQSSFIHGCTKRAEVMMVANALEFADLPVQEEILLRNVFDFPDSKSG